MEIETEIKKIKIRNHQSDIEKEWENSWTRRIAISVVTYAVIVVIMFALGIQSPFVNALIPTVAFVLSTMGLNFIKTIWVKIRKLK